MAVCGLHIPALDQDPLHHSQSQLSQFGPVESQSSEGDDRVISPVRGFVKKAVSGRNHRTLIVLIVLSGLLVIGIGYSFISVAGIYKTIVGVLIGIFVNRIV